MKTLLLATAASLLLVSGCSPEAPQKAEKKETAPPQPVKGRYALYQMFNAGRGWAPDIQVLRLRSIDMREVKADRGKSAVWEAYFVSAALGRARMYTYSVIEAEGNLHKGVFAGLEENWSGPRGPVKPFLIAAVKTDSDQVYETALKKAGDYEKKNPDKPISFLLEKNDQFPNPAWRVVWGENIASSNYSIFIDASTGLYLRTMR
ncbi:MAG TPA: hypothetical protein VNH83_03765 [Bryobacteraceae bacterium]|jgi:hypothetical protein|nr:hypothetical protein [Bryobacteraceae bacterium]